MAKQKIVNKSQSEKNQHCAESNKKDNLKSKSYENNDKTNNNKENNDLRLAEFNKNNSKSINEIFKIINPMTNNIQNITENFTRSIKPIIDSTNNISNLINNNLSFQLQNFAKSLTNSLYPSYLDFNKQLIDRIKPISTFQTEIINESIVNIVNQLNPVQEIARRLSDALKPITSQIIDNIPKMTSYFGELSKTLEKARKNPDSMLNWMEYSEKLSEYIWTIPYDISSEELKRLTSTVNSEKEFDKYMIKYFNKSKIEKLFYELLSRIPKKHKTILKQIQNSFYLGNYALINTGLLSIIDELCSRFLLDKGCVKRKDILLPIVEIVDSTSNDVFEVIPILILNENINVIYETIDFNKKIKIKTNKKVRRNPSQHGQYFSNRKIDTIMLLNTIYYLLIVMETYKKYVGKIIYVKNSSELLYVDTSHSNDVKRFYVRKKYIRKKK